MKWFVSASVEDTRTGSGDGMYGIVGEYDSLQEVGDAIAENFRGLKPDFLWSPAGGHVPPEFLRFNIEIYKSEED